MKRTPMKRTSLVGNWHVVRFSTCTSARSQRAVLYRFYRALLAAYRSNGAPLGFEIYRTRDSDSVYAYLSPPAAALAAEGLHAKGFKLIPLRREFDVGDLPSSSVERLLPR